VSFGALPPAVQHIKEGKLRALALTSTTSSPALPGVPSIAEAGYPQIAADIWTAVLVPAGTPRELTSVLQREIAKLMTQSEVKDRLATLGYQPVATSSGECAAHMAAEYAKWGKVIREAGIKAS
jgi:tripartite-type tricarboxylate transporter receptor subunit TctC